MGWVGRAALSRLLSDSVEVMQSLKISRECARGAKGVVAVAASCASMARGVREQCACMAALVAYDHEGCIREQHFLGCAVSKSKLER